MNKVQSTCIITWKRVSPRKHNVEVSIYPSWRTRTHPTFPRSSGWFTSRFEPLCQRVKVAYGISTSTRCLLSTILASCNFYDEIKFARTLLQRSRAFRSYRNVLHFLSYSSRFYYISVWMSLRSFIYYTYMVYINLFSYQYLLIRRETFL